MTLLCGVVILPPHAAAAEIDVAPPHLAQHFGQLVGGAEQVAPQPQIVPALRWRADGDVGHVATFSNLITDSCSMRASPFAPKRLPGQSMSSCVNFLNPLARNVSTCQSVTRTRLPLRM